MRVNTVIPTPTQLQSAPPTRQPAAETASDRYTVANEQPGPAVAPPMVLPRPVTYDAVDREFAASPSFGQSMTLASVLQGRHLDGVGSPNQHTPLMPLLPRGALPAPESLLGEMTAGEVLRNPDAIGEAANRWSLALWSGLASGVYDWEWVKNCFFVDWNSLWFFPKFERPALPEHAVVCTSLGSDSTSRQSDLNDWLRREIGSRSAGPQRQVIALTGGPGSGKSSLASELALTLRGGGVWSKVMGLDGYLYPLEKLFSERLGGLATFDTARFQADMQCCFTPGAADIVHLGVFDHQTMAVTQFDDFAPAEYQVIIVEGLFPLTFADVRDRFDLRIGIFIDGPTMLARMIQRTPDQAELQRVMFYHYQYAYNQGIVLPTLAAADIVLDVSTGKILKRIRA